MSATRISSAQSESGVTASIYALIRDGKHGEASRALTQSLAAFPRSRAALSLLGHCSYASADFRAAAQCYEELCRYYPEVDSYRLYYAQSLGKAGLVPEALRAAARVESEALSGRVQTLTASLAYAEGDVPAARAALDRAPPGDRDVLVNRACVAFKEGAVDEARSRFQEALAAGGWSPDLAYSVAACHYATKNYTEAQRAASEVISRGVREHPELSVGSGGVGADVRSVGNTPILCETYLIEAFNLKAAIELSENQADAARESLVDMPPRGEEELDPVTLHNSALASVDADPTAAFRKLNFLLSHPPFPPEAFGNVLLLYLRFGCTALAADALAENAHLTHRFLPPALYEFLDASLMAAHSAEEAWVRFDALAARHTDTLRRHTKAIQDARLSHDTERMKSALTAYDAALEAYVPVLLGIARLYWDYENYIAVERVLRQASEFAAEHDAWRLGMAHATFMQAGALGSAPNALEKYRESIRYYEPVVKRHLPGGNADVGGNTILDVTAIVLANLCVAYIMTGANDSAEEVMRAVESAEDTRLSASAAAAAEAKAGGAGATRRVLPSAPSFHLCIINLVVGTLYCSKGNTEFGVSRVLRALEPPARKLGTDTWYYAKRVLLHLGMQLSKGLLVVTDATFSDVLQTLDAAEVHGSKLPAVVAPPAAGADDADAPPCTIAAEARALKSLFLRLRERC
jgi:tetratricopeptide repeat protein 30